MNISFLFRRSRCPSKIFSTYKKEKKKKKEGKIVMVSILQIRCFLLSYLDFFCSIQREESNLFLKTGRFFLSCSNFSFHFTITRTCVNVVRVCRINLMDEFVERELLNKLVRQIHRIKLLNKSSRPNTLNEFVR